MPLIHFLIKYQQKKNSISSKFIYLFALTLIMTNLLKINSIEITNEISIDWFDTNFTAADIGVGSKGDVFVIGIDKNLYFYEFRTNLFILIEKDFKLKDKNFLRVDVDDKGIPFVVSEDLEIYFYSDKGKWVHLPGCARDIGIGKNRNLWKIGCNEELEGYGIWNLFCFNTQKNFEEKTNEHINSIKNAGSKSVPSLIYEKLDHERKMKSSNHYRRNKYRVYQQESTKINFGLKNQNEDFENSNEDYLDCFWLKSDAAGIRIDVGENGYPLIADKGGNLKIYNMNSKKTFFFEGVKVRDVTVSNDGIVFATDFNDFSIYKLSFFKKAKLGESNEKEVYVSNLKVDDEDCVDFENYRWTKISGKAISISAGPYSQPFIINREGLVMTSAKFGYN